MAISSYRQADRSESKGRYIYGICYAAGREQAACGGCCVGDA